MMRWGLLAIFCCSLASSCVAQDAVPQIRTTFKVRYIAAGSIYIDGGRNDGLAEGAKLVIRQSTRDAADTGNVGMQEPGIVAQLTVVSVAASSAVCDLVSTIRPIVVGDVVTLPQVEVEKRIQDSALTNTRQYPVIVSFTGGDPLDEDVRETVPHPPLPEVNQMRGRIGLDMSVIRGSGVSKISSYQMGMVVRADITRIYGTHWNLDGYWRGGFESSSAPLQPTLQDQINRTYQLALTYINPESRWTMGVGRLYLPWASSLEVIDGGYVGLQLSGKVTTGIFGGSSPDPTAWNYNPNRQLAGAFVNVHGGSFEKLWYSTTAGFAQNMLGWQVDRPLAFSETSLSYKRYFSIYDALQIDRPTANPSTPPVGIGIGQSLLTVRFQPQSRLSFDITDTYFRDVPTYDPQLIGTGLLDKYLFQGLSGGVRAELPYHLATYMSLGRSSNSTDTKGSWNSLYGLTMSNMWRTGLQADVRYSKFNSAFANGSYQSFTLSRELTGPFRVNLQLGRQVFLSPYSKDNGSRFLNTDVDMNIGSRYFLENLITVQRGAAQSYNQWTATFGYRFNNRRHGKE